ncbi:putative metal-binding motif-containing protein [Myxococcota bacterium]|nr:putative metal-binding motif-containing protein [Myxococcota bacterium]
MWPVVLEAACQGSPELTSTHDPPRISGISAAAGEGVVEGERAVLEAWVDTDAFDPEELVVTLLSDAQTPIASPAQPEPTGAVFLTTEPLLAGEHRLTVTVTDPLGASATATGTLEVRASTPPVAEVLSPVPGGIYYDALDLLLTGTVSDVESAPGDLLAWWIVDDEEVASSAPDGGGSTWALVPALAPGPHRVRLWVEDPSGRTDSAAVEFRVWECDDLDGDGFDCRSDCDDGDASRYPAAAEACNGLDDDCDGQVDEGFDPDLDGVPDCP